MSTIAAPAPRAMPAVATSTHRSQDATGTDERLASATPNAAFVLVAVYLVIDYARPHELPALSFLRALRPSLLLMIAALCYLLSRSHVIPWRERKIAVCGVIAFFMMAWVPFARNNFWAFQTWLDFCSVAVLIIAITSIVDTRERFVRFVSVWLVTLVFQSAWSLSHHGHGNGAYFGDENDVSLALSMGLPLALLSSFAAQSASHRALRAAFAICLVAGIVASRSRGGFVGLGVTWLSLLLLSGRKVLMVTATAVALAALLALAPAGYFEEMNTMQDERDSTRQARLTMWGVAWDAFVDNPVLGVGQGNIRWRINDYQIWDDRTGKSFAGHQVHSLYFTLLPELGVFGTTLYAWLLALNLKDARRVLRSSRGRVNDELAAYARGLLCTLAAFLSAGAFISVLYYPHFYYLTAMLLALRRIVAREQLARGGPAIRS